MLSQKLKCQKYAVAKTRYVDPKKMTFVEALTSELTYYPVYEPGTRFLEPGYPDSVVLYFLFLKFMLVELILATCMTECGRPTFSSCRVCQWLRLGFLLRG